MLMFKEVRVKKTKTQHFMAEENIAKGKGKKVASQPLPKKKVAKEYMHSLSVAVTSGFPGVDQGKREMKRVLF